MKTRVAQPSENSPMYVGPRAPVVADPVRLDVRLERARRLYIKTACGPELDALYVAEERRREVGDSPTGRRRDAVVELRLKDLRYAEERAGQIFDSVIAGGYHS